MALDEVPSTRVEPSEDEIAYRAKFYPDLECVKKTKVNCGICGKKVDVNAADLSQHPLVGVLCCKKCQVNNVHELSKKDCILCKAKPDYSCGKSNCKFKFCEKCLKRNSKSWKDAERKNWHCYICDPKPIWEPRAVCAVVMANHEKRSKKKKTELPRRRSSSESSSGKEFRPKNHASDKLRKSSIVNASLESLSVTKMHEETPIRAEEEKGIVSEDHAKLLKSLVTNLADDVNVSVKKIDEELQNLKVYCANRKIDTAKNSKFIAHKVRVCFNDIVETLQKNRNTFNEKYREWCKQCRPPTPESFILPNIENKTSTSSLEKIPSLATENGDSQNVAVSDCDSDALYSEDEKEKEALNESSIREAVKARRSTKLDSVDDNDVSKDLFESMSEDSNHANEPSNETLNQRKSLNVGDVEPAQKDVTNDVHMEAAHNGENLPEEIPSDCSTIKLSPKKTDRLLKKQDCSSDESVATRILGSDKETEKKEDKTGDETDDTICNVTTENKKKKSTENDNPNSDSDIFEETQSPLVNRGDSSDEDIIETSKKRSAKKPANSNNSLVEKRTSKTIPEKVTDSSDEFVEDKKSSNKTSKDKATKLKLDKSNEEKSTPKIRKRRTVIRSDDSDSDSDSNKKTPKKISDKNSKDIKGKKDEIGSTKKKKKPIMESSEDEEKELNELLANDSSDGDTTENRDVTIPDINSDKEIVNSSQLNSDEELARKALLASDSSDDETQTSLNKSDKKLEKSSSRKLESSQDDEERARQALLASDSSDSNDETQSNLNKSEKKLEKSSASKLDNDDEEDKARKALLASDSSDSNDETQSKSGKKLEKSSASKLENSDDESTDSEKKVNKSTAQKVGKSKETKKSDDEEEKARKALLMSDSSDSDNRTRKSRSSSGKKVILSKKSKTTIVSSGSDEDTNTKRRTSSKLDEDEANARKALLASDSSNSNDETRAFGKSMEKSALKKLQTSSKKKSVSFVELDEDIETKNKSKKSSKKETDLDVNKSIEDAHVQLQFSSNDSDCEPKDKKRNSTKLSKTKDSNKSSCSPSDSDEETDVSKKKNTSDNIDVPQEVNLASDLSDSDEDIKKNKTLEKSQSKIDDANDQDEPSSDESESETQKQTKSKKNRNELSSSDSIKNNRNKSKTQKKNSDSDSSDSEDSESEKPVNAKASGKKDKSTSFVSRKSFDPEEERARKLLLRSDSDDDSSEPESKPKKTMNNSKLKKLPRRGKAEDSNSSSDSDDNKAQEMGRKRKRCSDNFEQNKNNRKRFKVEKNRHYLADKKLRMVCKVRLERLPKRVLLANAKALAKSKRFVDDKKFKSIVNLDGLDKKRKGAVQDTDSSDNGSKRNRRQSRRKAKEDVETLMDHLDKVEENPPSDNKDDSDSTHSSTLPNMADAIITNEELLAEADQRAKEALLNNTSSNSDAESTAENNENEKEHETENEKENEKENDSREKKKKSKSSNNNESESKTKKQSKNDNKSSSEDDKDKEEKRAKSRWRKDKVLEFKLSDSEEEKEKWTKSQEKKRKEKEKEKNDDGSSSETKEAEKAAITKKKRSRVKRRVLDSDSDAQMFEISSSDSESSFQEKSKKKEDPKDSKKKKTKKRADTSDSDSSMAEKKPKSKRRRIKKVASDSDSENDDAPNSQGTPGKGRKNIRKVLKDKQVADDTKQAAKEEEDRLKRIADRQKLYNEMYEMRLAGEEKVEKLVLDFNEETKEEIVTVDKELVKRLKPHQAQGIKFMWDACFESIERIQSSKGSGCIIAHCMGLGKSFQVVTLAHTLLSHEKTGVNTVMVVCPLSTVLNWVNEFKMWLKDVEGGDDVEIYELTKMKKNFERKYQLESWQRTGGVLIIGYEMFRNLTSTGKRMRKTMQEAVMRALVDPGADLVVCDEGHLLKNEGSALSKAMRLVKTMRRIVLTGTPLQNNLVEYHCMVQFVKPNLLGTKKEFLNRFVNPIHNGQFDDSTPYDVKVMKKRAHVLHKMLEGSVQRFDYSVLTPFLPPKQEYVIFLRLTDVQIKMYQYYLDNLARRHRAAGGSLFADFQELQRIWTHPIVLRLNAEKVEKEKEKKRLEASDSEGSLRDFIDDDSDEDGHSSSSNNGSNSDVQLINSDSEGAKTKKRSTRSNPVEEVIEEKPEDKPEEQWWSQFIEPEHLDDMDISSKLLLLFGILKECEQIGDKVLVFSQSLYSLSLIEQFLNRIDDATQANNEEVTNRLDGHTGSWSLGLDYFRLDGQTSPENRSIWCKIFNMPTNTRARLFLISTRAGGLGINLTAANRVIIFDASWNPSHDVQSIFRIYRFGQKKPCYVYRFLAAGTMEEKIYNRQVTKLSLSCRVVDEQQIERHYSNNDLAELYRFEPHTDDGQTLNLPKDRLLAEIFLKYKKLVYNYHEHDSLLENKHEEGLDEEERKQAWQEYEDEKQGKRPPPPMMANYGMMPNYGMHMAPSMLDQAAFVNEFENIKMLIQKDFPTLTPEQQKAAAQQAMIEMYNYVDRQHVNNSYIYPTMPAMAGNMRNIPMQHQYNQQGQLLRTMLHPSPQQMPQQMNYGVNQMPTYSGRGRMPKQMGANPTMPMMRQQQMQYQAQPRVVDNDIMEIPIDPSSMVTTSMPTTPSTSDNKTQEE